MSSLVRLTGALLISLCAWSGVAHASDVDRILIEKAERRMTLFADEQIVAVYDIALGGAPVGHKQQEGDQRTPEGRYVIDFKNENSAFHLSLRISYPDAEDRARAQELELDPGGDIFIHGQPNNLFVTAWSKLSGDWTAGCIAVSNEEIEELWALVEIGTLVEIRP